MDVNAQSSITINTLMGYNQPLYNMNDDNETSFFYSTQPFFLLLVLFQDIDQPLHRESTAKQSAAWFSYSYHYLIKYRYLVGGFEHFFQFHIYIYGMSSQPHWLSLRHFSRWLVNHQPDIRYLPDVSMEKWGGNGIFVGRQWDTRPGKRLHSYGKSPSLMGKFTISTGPFSIAMSVSHYQRVSPRRWYGSLPETMVVLRDEHWADWANCHRLCGPDLCSGR